LGRRVETPKTPREIQLDELRRRRAKAMAPSEGEFDERPIGPKPFVRETIAASVKHFCWLCFENERDLLVAGVTGIHFCRECARSLVELSKSSEAQQLEAAP